MNDFIPDTPSPAIRSVTTTSTGGSLAGDRDYFLAVCAKDADGKFSLPSNVLSIRVPARVARELIDPNSAPLRSEPRDARDLIIAANNSWVLAFDNLSHLPVWFSDALCRLATGGGFSTRELYTDSEEVLFDAVHFIVHMSFVLGTSLEESLRVGRAVTRELLKNPPIRSVSQQVGRAEMADDTWGTHYSEFDVDLVPLQGEEAEMAQFEIRDALLKFPGAYFAIKPFLTERRGEILTGVTGQVVVKIFGSDLDELDRAAQEVSGVLGEVPGTADVQVEAQPGLSEMVVRLRPERMVQLGFQPVEVLDAVQAAYQGAVVSQTYEGNRVFDVSVILDQEARQEREKIGKLMLRSPEGSLIPLRELAEVYLSGGRYVVLHEGTRRRQTVTSNVTGRDVQSFVAEARERIPQRVRECPHRNSLSLCIMERGRSLLGN